MKKVFKYGPLFSSLTAIHLPEGAQVVSLGVQLSQLYLWAVVDNDLSISGIGTTRYFVAFGTGDNIPENYKYIDTCVESDYLVWHLFEKIE